MNVRIEAFHIIYHVLEENQYSHIELQQFMRKYPDADSRDKAFLERLVRGTLEHLYLIDEAINSVSKTKTDKMKPVIRNILRIAVCQLLYMDSVPDSAVCNEAVKMTVKMKFGPLKGFVNGVLRSLCRKLSEGYTPDPGLSDSPEALSLHYSIPLWIVEELIALLGVDAFQNMADALVEPVKLTVFNNSTKQDLEELIDILHMEHTECRKLPWNLDGLYLDHMNSLEQLKAFAEGRFLVQDISSMVQGLVASPTPGQYVIDACAAPGGKSFHAAIVMKGTGTVDSGDIGASKLRLLCDNKERLGLSNVRISDRDALVFDPQLSEKADILIADLPCSGLGIMGRKPEIRYNLHKKDITDLQQLQRSMLQNLYRYVKPGGRLIYSTCTITREENIENFRYITEALPFKAESLDLYLPEDLQGPTTGQGYLQLIPGLHPCDGFFIGSAIRQ